jgi:pimeloyl-[acyl-carrier protein] methyl ester esterase
MKLATEEFGKNNKKTLYLIHGWGLCSKVFYGIIPKLAQKYHVICIDLPGYGLNVDIPANRADGILHSLEETIKPNSAILGWSLGGVLAIKYLILHPKDHCLITCSSAPKFTHDPNTKWPGIENHLLEQFTKVLTADNSKAIINKFLSMQAMGSTTMKEDIKKLKFFLNEAPNPSYYELLAGLKTLMDEDLRGYVSRIECPSLHLYGKADRLSPVTQSYIWPQKENTKIYIFEKSSHAPFISEPDLFVEILSNFIDRYFN